MNGYCDGILQQVDEANAGVPSSVETMLAMRKLTIGVRPLFPLIEYACQLSIPHEVFTNAAITELQEVVVEIVSL